MSHTDAADFAAFVGIDWADQLHAVALVLPGHATPEHLTLPQTPEAIDLWATQLRERFPGQRIAVCLEQSRGALIFALLKYEHLVLYPINPKQLARYRQALVPSGAKDDPSDAALLADFLQHFHGRLRPWVPDDPDTRLLALLVEDRRHAVDLRTRLTNTLQARLKQYFPQALDLLGDLHSPLACHFLLRWPSLQTVPRAKPQTLRSFYLKHNSRSTARIDQRRELLAQAVPLTHDRAILDRAVLHVQTLARQLLELSAAIAQYDQRIEQLFHAHPDAEIFESFPGAGAALAPRLLSAFGSDRQRLSDASQMQQYSGIAPVTQRSGKRHRVTRRLACPRFLRQTFHEFASHSRHACAWAQAYDTRLRAQNKGHHAAVRALAFKWLRILFACWQSRTPYNDALYLQSLQRRNSPLLAFLPAEPARP